MNTLQINSTNPVIPFQNFSFKRILDGIIDFIAPAHCIVCKDYTGSQQGRSKFICNKCYDNIPFAEDKEVILNRFYKNFGKDNCYIFEATSSINLLDESKYLEIIHALKYQKFKSSGIEFGLILAQRILLDKMTNYDLIVPIPIHKAKQRERGFNQSDIIAITVADALNMKFNNKLLYRNRYTVTQTLLNQSQRKKNMINVFSVNNADELQMRSVLLIDDVLTTGSTLNSAAELLIKSGAAKVGVATIALAN